MKKWGLLLALAACILMLMGCGGGETIGDNGHSTYYPSNSEAKEPETEFKINRDADLYILEKIDQETQLLQVYRISNGLEYQFRFNLSTEFVDKYEDRTPSANFAPGKVIELKTNPSDNVLVRVQLSDEVWEYTDVSRFSVEEARGIFYIAEDKYNYDDTTFVFSDEDRLKMEDLTDNDQLTVYGKDKKIISVVVTTGHGNLQLMNTLLFEGSFLQLGRNIFSVITPNMKMEVPEGTYTLAVANDGWGGTCEIEIVRGQTTEVDLDQIKGEGPKYGKILFVIELEGAKLMIDNREVDYSIPLKLRYGWHTMSVTASGYDDWSKRLYVNSDEATISIELEEKSTATTTGSSGGGNAGNTTTENGAGTTDANTTNGTTNSGTNNADQDYLADYLSTLTDLIGSL